MPDRLLFKMYTVHRRKICTVRVLGAGSNRSVGWLGCVRGMSKFSQVRKFNRLARGANRASLKRRSAPFLYAPHPCGFESPSLRQRLVGRGLECGRLFGCGGVGTQVAERGGFEPPGRSSRPTVFKTAALNRSAISPWGLMIASNRRMLAERVQDGTVPR